MFDYPIFDMPLFGHRLIFAFDAILHVFISHGAAVGGSVILALSQWTAIKNNDRKFDELAYKILFTFFILATAIGALTGIGIWVHVNIINPAAIGALLRAISARTASGRVPLFRGALPSIRRCISAGFLRH